jgi:hypothetical protein
MSSPTSSARLIDHCETCFHPKLGDIFEYDLTLSPCHKLSRHSRLLAGMTRASPACNMTDHVTVTANLKHAVTTQQCS